MDEVSRGEEEKDGGTDNVRAHGCASSGRADEEGRGERRRKDTRTKAI